MPCHEVQGDLYPHVFPFPVVFFVFLLLSLRISFWHYVAFVGIFHMTSFYPQDLRESRVYQCASSPHIPGYPASLFAGATRV